MDRCPDCNSDRVIPWNDGYICCSCSCGCEFDEIDNKETQEEEY